MTTVRTVRPFRVAHLRWWCHSGAALGTRSRRDVTEVYSHRSACTRSPARSHGAGQGKRVLCRTKNRWSEPHPQTSEEASMSTVDDTKDPIPEVMPLIPLRDLVLFPNLVVPLFVGREKSILALEEAMRGDHHVALVAQLLPDTQEPGAADLHVVGCVGTVLQELKLPDGTAKALVEGVARIRIVEYVTTEPYLQVRVETVEEEASSDLETTALMRALVG